MFSTALLPVRALLVLLLLTAACRDSTSPEESFNAARAKWTRVGPVSYAMTIHFSCSECGIDNRLTGPVIIAVRNGRIESKTYAGSQLAVVSPYYAGFPSIEELFTVIDMSIRRDSPHIAEYDPAMGYPLRVETETGGADWIYTVTNFEAK